MHDGRLTVEERLRQGDDQGALTLTPNCCSGPNPQLLQWISAAGFKAGDQPHIIMITSIELGELGESVLTLTNIIGH